MDNYHVLLFVTLFFFRIKGSVLNPFHQQIAAEPQKQALIQSGIPFKSMFLYPSYNVHLTVFFWPGRWYMIYDMTYSGNYSKLPQHSKNKGIFFIIMNNYINNYNILIYNYK